MAMPDQIKPWADLTEIERRRVRRYTAAAFESYGLSRDDAARMARLVERLADDPEEAA